MPASHDHPDCALCYLRYDNVAIIPASAWYRLWQCSIHCPGLSASNSTATVRCSHEAHSVKAVAKAIIDGQTKEIAQMNAMLAS